MVRSGKKDRNLKTVPGSRSLYYFAPLTHTVTWCKTTSLEDKFILSYDISPKQITVVGCSVHIYVGFTEIVECLLDK